MNMHRWPASSFERHVRRLALTTESVRFTAHAKLRMAERRILFVMVLECLRCGVIRRPPERNIKTGWYECRMERYVSGRNLAVVAAIEEASPRSDRGDGD